MKKIILITSFVVVLLTIPGGYSYFSPKITSQPALDPHEGAVFLIEGHPFPYQPEVRYDIPVTWHLNVSPTDSDNQLQVSINPETGEILWNDKRKGIWQVTVTASNWAGRDSQTFKVNRIIKPFIKTDLPSTITAQQDFKGSLEVSGSQSLEISCSNPDIVIEDFTINWPAPKAGKYSIQFTASNPAGKHTRNWTVNVEEHPVKITSKPQKTTTAGTDYKYQVKAIGTPEFQWKLEDAPEGMSLGRKGIVLWPADSAREGNYTVNIKVSNIVDSKTHTDTQTFTLQCKKKEEEKKEEKKVEKQKKKKSKKLTNVKVKRVFKEDKIIKKQKKIIQDQEKLLEKLPKQFKPEQKKAIDAQKEAIKRAEEARKRALQLKKLKAEEERLEAERKEKERQRIEAEKLKEILRQQEEAEQREAERQRILKAQKEAEQRETERQRLLKDQREKERQEALRKELEMRKKQKDAREKYLETQRKAREAEERAKREEAARQEALRKKQEALKKQQEALRRQAVAQKKAELLKQQEIELRKRQEEAKRKQEESKRKYLEEQQRLREASEKARRKQEKVARRLREQKDLKKQAEEAERIAKRQRKIEEELRKQRMTKKVSVPTKRDMSREKIEKGKKIDLRYDFVMTGWSFADFSRLAKNREFKILFMSRFKAIQPENYEVTGLGSNGNPVVQKRSWDDGVYPGKGCIVAEIPTEGKDLWKDYDTNLRRKLRVGSHTLTLFFPYHFFTYLEEAAKSYYDVHKINPDISFKQGAGKIKFTITKDYKFKILSMGNTR